MISRPSRLAPCDMATAKPMKKITVKLTLRPLKLLRDYSLSLSLL